MTGVQTCALPISEVRVLRVLKEPTVAKVLLGRMAVKVLLEAKELQAYKVILAVRAYLVARVLPDPKEVRVVRGLQGRKALLVVKAQPEVKEPLEAKESLVVRALRV